MDSKQINADEVYGHANGECEHILPLDNGRQLSFTRNGPSNARTVILFFSGLFSVGSSYDVAEPCRAIGAQSVAPTLPGMGHSSTRRADMSYHESLARDMNALLAHLYPRDDYDALYVAGGSYGTVPAQMLFGASYSIFPAGRKIVGCVLLAGFSPLKYHTDYQSSLTWANWFSVGPPSRLPFRILQRIFKSAIGPKLATQQGAETLLRQLLFNDMDAEERSIFDAWLLRKGESEHDLLVRMARGAVASSENWDGFMEVSDVLHSDWGFDYATLDDEHTSKPVLIVTSARDKIGGRMNMWLADATSRSSRLMTIPGGHISSLFYMDEIWAEILKLLRDS